MNIESPYLGPSEITIKQVPKIVTKECKIPQNPTKAIDKHIPAAVLKSCLRAGVPEIFTRWPYGIDPSNINKQSQSVADIFLSCLCILYKNRFSECRLRRKQISVRRQPFHAVKDLGTSSMKVGKIGSAKLCNSNPVVQPNSKSRILPKQERKQP